MAKNKNGMIELMRFIFCIIIILFHLNNRNPFVYETGLTFFKHGRIGVEFFFLVSGYLLANTAHKHYDTNNVTHCTAGFMYKKIMSIFPYHFFVFIADVIIFCIVKESHKVSEFLQKLLSYIPGLFFLQKSGIKCIEVNTIEWYIPVMLISMAILYPLVLTYKDKFTKIACPIITIFTIGYLIYSTGELGGVKQYVFNDILPKVYVRAFSEMCAGVFIYEVVHKFNNRELSKPVKAFLSVTEIFCYVSVILFSFSNWDSVFEGQFFYALTAAVGLSFSGKTITANAFNNKVIYFLGKLSLPLYLSQSIALNIFDNSITLQNLSHGWQIFYVLAASIEFSLIIMAVGDITKYLIKKRRKNHNKNLAR